MHSHAGAWERVEKLLAEGYVEVSEKIGQLKMKSLDGKMPGEATTTKLHRDRETEGFEPLKQDAKDGGAVAGRTRKDIEKQAGKPVVSGENFKTLTRKKKKIT